MILVPVACAGPVEYEWVHQPDAILNQVNPGSGVVYPVLAATPNVRIISAAAWVNWTVQPTPLELYVVIDGVTITHTVANPANGTKHEALINPGTGANSQTLLTPISESRSRSFLYTGRSVEVNAEITGGTVQSLWSLVKWARKVLV